MAIQESFTTGVTAGTPINPTNTMSVFGVQGEFKGTVSLVATFPGASASVVVKQVTEANFLDAVLTPDPAIVYNILGNITEGTANVYFGE